MKPRSWLVACAVILSWQAIARAEPAAAGPPVLVVGTHDDPPFVIKQASGEWTGISIELLRTIAAELGTTITVKEVERTDVVSGKLPDVDIVATLNVSEKMNARYELSHTFYFTGLAIAVPDTKKESVIAIAARILSGPFLWVLVITVVLLVAVGSLMWWVEKRPVKPVSTEKQALSKALFWAFEPVIGYKASQHSTRAGRVIGTIWGIFGVVLVSGLTASLASQLTAQKLAPSVRGPDDLPRVRVAVVNHTAGLKFCDRRGIRRTMFEDLETALTALDEGRVEVVIEDAPNLSYAAQNTHKQIRVLPGTFSNHGYAFGLRPDSPLRHDFNRALLKSINADSWRSVVASYLGQAE